MAEVSIGDLVVVAIPNSVRTGFTGKVIEAAKVVDGPGTKRFLLQFASGANMWYYDTEVEPRGEVTEYAVGDMVTLSRNALSSGPVYEVLAVDPVHNELRVKRVNAAYTLVYDHVTADMFRPYVRPDEKTCEHCGK